MEHPNEEWWMMKDEWWMMLISSCWGVLLKNGRTDICDCRVAFAFIAYTTPYYIKNSLFSYEDAKWPFFMIILLLCKIILAKRKTFYIDNAPELYKMHTVLENILGLFLIDGSIFVFRIFCHAWRVLVWIHRNKSCWTWSMK